MLKKLFIYFSLDQKEDDVCVPADSAVHSGQSLHLPLCPGLQVLHIKHKKHI